MIIMIFLGIGLGIVCVVIGCVVVLVLGYMVNNVWVVFVVF